MITKQLILEILERNRDKNISGEAIADLLNISRNLVWRAIRDLRNDGYMIDASTNKGYRLSGENDIISIAGIKPFLLSEGLAENIVIYSVIDSTNREAKARAVNKAAHGTVIISNSQTNGRGRYNRDFFSPPGGGLYMSFILYADVMGFSNPTVITAYAALCVCEAIESVCGVSPSIKWINDIFLDGKKIGGILTEAITEFESRNIGEIILGIGVNVSTKTADFPESVRERVTSIYPQGHSPITRNRLAAEIINRVLLSNTRNEAELLERYKKRLFMLGSNILVVQGDDKYEAKALDIDERGYLIVQQKNGGIKTLSSGDVIVS